MFKISDFENLKSHYSYKGIIAILKYCNNQTLQCQRIYQQMRKKRNLRAVSIDRQGNINRLWYNPERDNVYNTTKENCLLRKKRATEKRHEYYKEEKKRLEFLENLNNPEW